MFYNLYFLKTDYQLLRELANVQTTTSMSLLAVLAKRLAPDYTGTGDNHLTATEEALCEHSCGLIIQTGVGLNS